MLDLSYRIVWQEVHIFCIEILFLETIDLTFLKMNTYFKVLNVIYSIWLYTRKTIEVL